MTTKAAIYARFSSDKQTDRSIEDQVALCRAICEREGLIVVAVYDDRAISGASTLNRLGWQRLMRDAKAGKFNVVVAEALDRISRDQEDLAGIHKRLRFANVEIRTAQDGIAGDIHIGVKGLLGSLYLKDLAQKTKRGQAGVVRDGRHNGGRSYGYRPIPGKPGELEIDQGEAAAIRQIFADYLDARSPRDIATALNRKGLPGPRGGVWNASTIGGSRKRLNGILQNELYAGRIVWNRQTFIKDPRDRQTRQPRKSARSVDDRRRRTSANNRRWRLGQRFGHAEKIAAAVKGYMRRVQKIFCQASLNAGAADRAMSLAATTSAVLFCSARA